MTTTDLRLAGTEWAQARKQFMQSFRGAGGPETGMIGVIGTCTTAHRSEYIAGRIFWPGPGDLKIARSGALVFDASYIRRAHLFMREKHLAGLVFFHTHPGADDHVAFSSYDDQQEPIMRRNLIELEPRTQLVSVVIGRTCQQGRVWLTDKQSRGLGKLVVVGESLSYLGLSGQAPPTPPAPAAAFDRGRALTGHGALALLSSLRVAVVGASGTGSLVCELLMRAGCRRLLLIDDKASRDVNLNRIIHLSRKDVTKHAWKVDVLHREIRRAGMDCDVEVIIGNILDERVLSQLRDADVVFGCVDAAFPRLLLSRFAYQYFRPYIDVGSEIGFDTDGVVTCLTSRANYVAPGRPCLRCTGLVTPRQLHLESMAQQERERVVEQGYSADLVMDQPAVMDLNMRAASLGTMILRHLLQPFLLRPLPITINENLATYTMLASKTAKAANPQCGICCSNDHAGFGDLGPSIGLDAATVKGLIGHDGWHKRARSWNLLARLMGAMRARPSNVAH
jgi:molybdopterin/thiamine biosynthesis adenylyltransferase